MGHVIRLFCTVPIRSVVLFQSQLFLRGFQAQPVGTNQLDILYDPTKPPITVDLITANQAETQQQIAEFLEAVSKVEESPTQKQIIDVLARTQSLIFIGAEDDGSDIFNHALNTILDVFGSNAEGLFHIDGEGFYEGNNLILRL